MMKRIAIVLAVGGVLVGAALALKAWTTPQKSEAATVQTKKVAIVTVVTGMEQIFGVFKRTLAELGHVEGKNVEYIEHTVGSMDELDATLKLVVQEGADIVVTVATPETQRAKALLKDTGIPVFFTSVSFPSRANIVQNFPKPEGHVTGIKVGGESPLGLGWLVQAVPTIKNVLVLHNPEDSNSALEVADIQGGAKKLGVAITVCEVTSLKEAQAALASKPEGVDAVLVPAVGSIIPWVKDIADACIKHKLPLYVPGKQQLDDDGGLIAVGTDPKVSGRQMARMAGRLLDGVAPSDLPVEMAEFCLYISVRTANKIGIKVPSDVLQQADMIIR